MFDFSYDNVLLGIILYSCIKEKKRRVSFRGESFLDAEWSYTFPSEDPFDAPDYEVASMTSTIGFLYEKDLCKKIEQTTFKRNENQESTCEAFIHQQEHDVDVRLESFDFLFFFLESMGFFSIKHRSIHKGMKPFAVPFRDALLFINNSLLFLQFSETW